MAMEASAPSSAAPAASTEAPAAWRPIPLQPVRSVERESLEPPGGAGPGVTGRGQRVIVLSNYATDDMRRRCFELGADAVFDKSREIDALVDYCLALGAPGGR